MIVNRLAILKKHWIIATRLASVIMFVLTIIATLLLLLRKR
jgi:hypothetical protein